MTKDSSRTTAGELQTIFESRGQNTFKKIVKQHLHHHMLHIQHIQLSDTTGTSNGTGFYGQIKLKNEIFRSKRSRWVW